MKILVTYDFISTNNEWGKSSCKKIDFITKILTYLAIDVKVDECKFDRKKLFELSYKTFKQDNLEIITLEKLSKNSLDYILNYIKEYDLLISYEFSHESKQILDSLGIKYIDIWVSPIRFCEDLMFEFYSNEEQINSKIKLLKYDEKLIYQRAKKIKNQSLYFHNQIKIQDNSALLIGQLGVDKAIFKNGIFLNLSDFKDDIKQMSNKYKKIYFLKHPLMMKEELHGFLENFKDIKNFEYLQNTNTYDLLSYNEIKSVYAISSSVLEEAKYFKKNVKYFFKPVIDKRYTRIFKEYYKSIFWENLLGIETKKDNIEFLVDDNYIRYKYDAFFAYKDFVEEQQNKELKIYNIIVNFYQFIEHLPKNKEYILYGYGSVGKIIFPLIKKNIIGIIDKSIIDDFLIIDNLKIKIFKIEDLTAKDNVIITPFKYNSKIKKELLEYIMPSNIIEINLL